MGGGDPPTDDPEEALGRGLDGGAEAAAAGHLVMIPGK